MSSAFIMMRAIRPLPSMKGCILDQQGQRVHPSAHIGVATPDGTGIINASASSPLPSPAPDRPPPTFTRRQDGCPRRVTLAS
jgi:hypothetical protein